LSELSNLDIDLDLSDSGDLWIRDGEDEIYVNVEEIAGQVEAVLSETFARMSRAWDDHAEVRPEGAEPTDLLDAEAGELQREVERLRQEMADLQKELRRLRQEQRH
jgi:transposase-like protein